MSVFMLLRTQYAVQSMRIMPSLSSKSMRIIHSTSSQPETINNITQGHSTNPKNTHPQDVSSQAVRGASEAKGDEENESIDAAKRHGRSGREEKPDDMGKGNPEGIGFVEQVGGASASARKFEQEENSNKK